jgi:hypothetical protein
MDQYNRATMILGVLTKIKGLIDKLIVCGMSPKANEANH